MQARKRLSIICQKCRDFCVFIQVKFRSRKNGNLARVKHLTKSTSVRNQPVCFLWIERFGQEWGSQRHSPSSFHGSSCVEQLFSPFPFNLFFIQNYLLPFHSELNAFKSFFCSVLSPSTRSMFLNHFRFCLANFEGILTLMTTLSEPLLKLWSPKLAVRRLK